MGYLIFLIVLVWVIKTVADQNKAAGNKRIPRGTQQYTNRTIQKEEARPALSENIRDKGGNISDGTRDVHRSSPKSSVSDGPAEKMEEDISTTEYLRQKALEDEKEHREEARQEAMRLNREAGGRMTARRYIDGDSIPKGMHVEKCRYCGAENLIADHKRKEEYTCYFCREIL